MISIDDYIYRSISFEDSLDEIFKKEHGIFYTDPNLAMLMLKDLDLDKEGTLIDPCVGLGSFVYAAKSMGMQNVYGIDFDKKTVEKCKQLTGNDNIFCMDSIGTSPNEIMKKLRIDNKFDYVVGNPPYVTLDKNIIVDSNDYLFTRTVKDSGSNLFVAALYRAFELAKVDGIISYIIPKNFLHVSSYASLRKKILKEKAIISIIDIGQYFKNVRGEQIILTIKNSMITDNKIKIGKFENNEIKYNVLVEQDFYNNEIMIFESDYDYLLFKKLENSYEKFDDICTGYVGRGKSKNNGAISGRDIRKFGFKNRKVPEKGNLVFIQNIYSSEAGIIATFAGELEAKETVTVFTDGDEKMCRYILGILHSRLCNYYLQKFCYNNSKLTMHTDAKYLKRIPLVKENSTFNKVINIVKLLETIEYMSDEWFEALEDLNDLVYQTYKINNEERTHIDKEVRKIQSKRWNSGK